VSRYFNEHQRYSVKDRYTYKLIDANTDIFIEMDNDQLTAGCRGLHGMEKELAGVLNHRQFDRFFPDSLLINQKIK
jgi:hypothetical protein